MATRCEECESYDISNKGTCNDCGSKYYECVCVCCYTRNICAPYNFCTECLIAFKMENTLPLKG